MLEIVIPRRAFCLSGDLILPSRIEAAMRSAQVPFRRIGGDDFGTIRGDGGILFLDLGIGIEKACELIRGLRSEEAPIWRVCVFGPHLDREGLQAVRDAGADRAVSRSYFVTNLEQIVNELVAGAS